jgi:hypothetical protein
MSIATECCRYCGSDKLVHMPCPSGPHHARECCLACGRQLRWVGRPLEPWRAADVALPVYRPTHPVPLTGTVAQVEAACRIRARLLTEAKTGGAFERGLIPLLKSVTSAPWFLANGLKPRSQWRRPTPAELGLEGRD